MGRGRVELKRVENKVNRQVTFSKRRSGLLKKASEISLLCDADVALIVFSAKSKLFHFATDSHMARILERYERHSSSEKRLDSTDLNSNGSWALQHAELQSRIDILQRNQRNLIGDDLDPLNLRELQNLENELENALKHMRLKKNQLMNQTIAEIQKKDRAMQEQNNVLGKKMKQREKELADQGQVDTQSFDASPPSIQISPAKMQPIDINMEIISWEASGSHNRPSTSILPAWMLTGRSK